MAEGYRLRRHDPVRGSVSGKGFAWSHGLEVVTGRMQGLICYPVDALGFAKLSHVFMDILHIIPGCSLIKTNTENVPYRCIIF